jgi:hypothetical protein
MPHAVLLPDMLIHKLPHLARGRADGAGRGVAWGADQGMTRCMHTVAGDRRGDTL